MPGTPRSNTTQAIADYDAAIKVDPKNAGAYLGRGLSRAARNQQSQAIADFSEAIWLDPLSTSAYYNRGRAWQSKHEYAKAIIDFNMALRLDPEQAAVHRERGNAWEAQKNYRKRTRRLQRGDSDRSARCASIPAIEPGCWRLAPIGSCATPSLPFFPRPKRAS